MAEDYFLIARITSAAGRDGFVKILSYTDFPDRFFDLVYVYVDFFNEKKKLFIEEVKKKKDQILIKFKNFDTPGDVELLIGREVLVDKEHLVNLPENQFFIHDLIGSTVYRNDKLLGRIDDVLTLPANDVYVIIDPDGNEILIPAIKDLILKFDPEKKEMILKPGEDLYETDEN